MSEKIKQAIKDNVVKPEMQKYVKPQVGQVTYAHYEAKKYTHEEDDYLEKYNLPVANVRIVDERTNDTRELKGVPILHSAIASGVDGRKIRRGDRVMILFYRDNDSSPFIIGRVFTEDDELEEEMRSEKGAYKSDANGHF